MLISTPVRAPAPAEDWSGAGGATPPPTEPAGIADDVARNRAELGIPGPGDGLDAFGGSEPAAPPQKRSLFASVGIGGIITLLIGGFFVVRAIGNLSSGPERDASGQVVEAGSVDVQDLQRRDCFNLDDDLADSVFSAEVVPCDQVHTYEVYALLTYPANNDAPYPGQELIFQWSDDGCWTEFESYVGTPYLDSILEFGYLYPEPDGWDELDDRTVACWLTGPGGTQIVGTKLNSQE